MIEIFSKPRKRRENPFRQLPLSRAAAGHGKTPCRGPVPIFPQGGQNRFCICIRQTLKGISNLIGVEL